MESLALDELEEEASVDLGGSLPLEIEETALDEDHAEREVSGLLLDLDDGEGEGSRLELDAPEAHAPGLELDAPETDAPGLELDDEKAEAEAEASGLELDDDEGPLEPRPPIESVGLPLLEAASEVSTAGPRPPLQPLPDSAFIDSPDSSTRDLLLDALGTTELELGGDESSFGDARGRDAAHGDGPPRKKTYSFLPDSLGSERRGATRFPLALDTEIIDGKRRIRAFATSGSVDAFFIRTKEAIEPDQKLMAELRMLGSYHQRMPAVVIRLTENGLVLQLDPNPKTLAFRSSFLELARQPSMQAPHLRLELLPPDKKSDSRPVEAPKDEIAEAWEAVLVEPHDEEVNQEFIHTCMRAQNLEYAVERYREQHASGNVDAEKYLDQIGTILGFYNMPQNDIPLDADGFATGRTKGWVALILTLIVAVGAARFLIGRDTVPNSVEPKQSKRGGGLINVDWDFGD